MPPEELSDILAYYAIAIAAAIAGLLMMGSVL